jgi:hypothetical protein
MQMIDGFNEGWIDFKTQGANGPQGRVTIDEAVAALVAIEEKRQVETSSRAVNLRRNARKTAKL